jgi:hypothetical protein
MEEAGSGGTGSIPDLPCVTCGGQTLGQPFGLPSKHLSSTASFSFVCSSLTPLAAILANDVVK